MEADLQILAAITAGADQPFEVVTADLDEPHEDEILVRDVGVGVCHTDLVVQALSAAAFAELAPFERPLV